MIDTIPVLFSSAEFEGVGNPEIHRDVAGDADDITLVGLQFISVHPYGQGLPSSAAGDGERIRFRLRLVSSISRQTGEREGTRRTVVDVNGVAAACA